MDIIDLPGVYSINASSKEKK
ncbi:hypothetical protein QW060_27765 [Myroides ceti]|uniref:Uncharacterized protein n=1 Tax=Paenimyroides ceti TaxID=395087 RepID=A0ABT8D156_9FLAO|nr:hypothetical protein [Paenimyroides ceti]MDN3710583.1 hypothetical protein [Paenimyroides ceti]